MATTPPLKQEIEQKDFKGDIFGKKFSLVKDEKTGEVMFDFVELPQGFDVKSIKCFRVIGKSIAEVEAELRKLLKKEAPTAENTGKGAEAEFKKMTVEELSLLDDIKIAEHISAGLAAKAYTAEEADKLGKDTAAAKAAGKGANGNAEARAAAEAARTAEAAAAEGRKQGVLLALIDEFKRKEDWINKEGEIDDFLAEKADQTSNDAEFIAQIKAAIVKAIADEPKVGVVGEEEEEEASGPPPFPIAKAVQRFKTFLTLTDAQNLAGKTEADITQFLDEQEDVTPENREEIKAILMAALAQNNPSRGEGAGNAGAPAEGGKRSRKHKKQKKSKTRKHKK
jgi:hypothetical protein